MWMQTIRHGLIGAVAGALASTFLITTFPTMLPALFLGSVFGAAIALLLDGRHSGLDDLLTTAALGVPVWRLVGWLM